MSSDSSDSDSELSAIISYFAGIDDEIEKRYSGESSDSDSEDENELFSEAPLFTEAPVHDIQYTPRNVTDRNIVKTKTCHTEAKQRDYKINNVSSVSKSDTNNSDNNGCTNKKSIEEGVTCLKTKKEMDEYDLYGQLLVKKLRKLDEHQRDVAMHEIDNIMFRAKMQSSTNQTHQQPCRSYSASPSPVPRKVKSPVFIVAQQTNIQYEDENIYQQDPMQTQTPH